MADKEFFGDGLFDWQISSKNYDEIRRERCFDRERYWGGFSTDPIYDKQELPDWAIGPFSKLEKPVFAPDKKSWDKGHLSGGAHNGSILFRNNKFYYIYRGEMPHELIAADKISGGINVIFDYICDIGIATSIDGIHFKREQVSPLFRKNNLEKYSFEDVNCVEYDGVYYLFCNRWNFSDPINPKECGVCLATSTDLNNFEMRGLVFPNAKRIHRNAVVVQNPNNQAVKINGKFIMYLNDGLIAESTDMLNWTSREIDCNWKGGEGCFAVTNYSKKYNDKILLFTGGHHSGHFYAIGEVLFDVNAPEKAIDYLQRPVLKCDEFRPYENGYDANDARKLVSSWRDTIFFTGMTLKDGEWLCYYGGSEYYTCLAKAKERK